MFSNALLMDKPIRTHMYPPLSTEFGMLKIISIKVDTYPFCHLNFWGKRVGVGLMVKTHIN